MKPTHLALLLGAAVAAGGLGLWAGSRWGGRPGPAIAALDIGGEAEPRNAPGQPAIAIGDPAPAIELPGLDGQSHRLAAFRGRPVLVNFWASWCGPCIEEMPMLDAFAAAQGANGVQVVGIALDERAAVEAFLHRTPVRYPLWLDAPGANDSSVRLGNARGVLPYSVLIDAQGRVAAQKTGPFRGDELARFARR